MISYPQQSIQQKSEYDSLSILSYALRHIGILRNEATNDFGIDLEIDFVSDGSVSGRIIKAQVKSSQNLSIKKDGSVSIEGIKQSTLAYWMRVSLSCPVIVFAVDVNTEAIYFSEPIHKQAASLIDGTGSSKTVQLIYQLNKGKGIVRLFNNMKDHALMSEQFAIHAKEFPKFFRNMEVKMAAHLKRDQLFFAYLDEMSYDSNLREEINLHLRCLENVKSLIELQDPWNNCNLDKGTEIFDLKFFEFFLKAAKVLIGYWPLIDYCKKHELDISKFHKVQYWQRRSNIILQYCSSVTYEGTRDHIPFVVNLLLTHMVARRNAMLSAEAHYWLIENPDYLRLVFNTNIILDEVDKKHCISDEARGLSDFEKKVGEDTKDRAALYEANSKAKRNRKGLAIGGDDAGSTADDGDAGLGRTGVDVDDALTSTPTFKAPC